jgi:hypothetical protein
VGGGAFLNSEHGTARGEAAHQQLGLQCVEFGERCSPGWLWCVFSESSVFGAFC